MTAADEVRLIIETVIERKVRESDDYFDAGGDSLSTIEIIDVVRERFGREIDPYVFIEARTVGELAKRIESLIAAESQ